MGSLPPRARFIAACVTVVTAVAIPAVAGATTSDRPGLGPEHNAQTVIGTDGNDTIIGRRYVDRVDARSGDDYVRLAGGNDRASGGPGNDWLHGNNGRDVVDGGPGDDHPQGGGGNDRVYGGDGNDELDGDAGNDYLYAGPGDDSVTGDEGDDVIYPGPGADEIYGEEGHNKIVARDDGVRDDIFCNKLGTPPGEMVYIGKRDWLDALRNCTVTVVQD